jgi:hypothetical protein
VIFQPGQLLTAEQLNTLQADVVREIVTRCIKGDGRTIRVNAQGVESLVISAIPGPRIARAIASWEAFDAATATESTPQARIRVKPGTANGYIEGDGLTLTDGDTATEDGWWLFDLTASATKYGILHYSDPDAGVYTTATFSLEDSIPAAEAGDTETGDPPPNAYRAIFKVVTDSSYRAKITQYTSGAQQALVFVTAWGCSTITKAVAFLP